jgi:hypothetical protein
LLGGFFSFAALVVPLFFVGTLSSTISGDLETVADDLGWTVQRDPTRWRRHEVGMRAEWRHASGLELLALAEPLAPFDRPRWARLRWVEDNSQRPGAVANRLNLGERRVLRVSELLQPPGEPSHVHLRYIIMDDEGRDQHTLFADVAAGDLDRTKALVEELVPTLTWISAAPVDQDDGW